MADDKVRDVQPIEDRVVKRLEDFRNDQVRHVAERGWVPDERRITVNAAKMMARRDDITADRLGEAVAKLEAVRDSQIEPESYGRRVARLAVDTGKIERAMDSFDQEAEKKGWDRTRSRAEWHGARALARGGASVEDTRAALNEVVRGRPTPERAAYVERTAQKAYDYEASSPKERDAIREAAQKARESRQREAAPEKAEPDLTARRGSPAPEADEVGGH